MNDEYIVRLRAYQSRFKTRQIVIQKDYFWVCFTIFSYLAALQRCENYWNNIT